MAELFEHNAKEHEIQTTIKFLRKYFGDNAANKYLKIKYPYESWQQE